MAYCNTMLLGRGYAAGPWTRRGARLRTWIPNLGEGSGSQLVHCSGDSARGRAFWVWRLGSVPLHAVRNSLALLASRRRGIARLLVFISILMPVEIGRLIDIQRWSKGQPYFVV
jgi:hypothetical protein